MGNGISSGLRQGLGIRFWLGVLGVLAVIGTSSVRTLIELYRDPRIQPEWFHLDFLLQALDSDSFPPFVAIVAVLPFAGNYVDEVKSKFARFSMLRTGYGPYLLSRAAVCFLLGGTVILAGVLTAYWGCTLLFSPMELAAKTSREGVLAGRCLLMFLSGGFWALLGMTLSTLMESKYIAYASPFVVYYLLVMLCERYFPKAYLLYPREWLNPSEKWPLGIWGAAVFLIEMTVLLGILFCYRGKRRLEQL